MNIPSPLLDRLAQLLVLYEHLRIEAFAVTTSADESMELDVLNTRHRVRHSIQRFAVALLEFDCALSLLSQTDEYKSAEANAENNREMKDLMATVANASRHFDARHELTHSLGNFIGEQSGDAAEITFHLTGASGGALSDAGQRTAPALAMSRAIEPSPEQVVQETKDALCTIRDSYAHATEAIHALVAAFVRDRL
jgi:hypothetical protein